MRDGFWVLPALAQTLYMYLLCLSKFPTMFTLSDGAAFLLDFEKRTIGVFTGARAMAFDARLAEKKSTLSEHIGYMDPPTRNIFCR